MEALFELLVTPVLLVVVIVLAFPFFALMHMLDESHRLPDGSDPPHEERPLKVRMRDAAQWVLPGVLIALVLASQASATGALIIGFLAVFNLIGTTRMLRELFPGAPSARLVKWLFVLQIPIGTLITAAENM